MNLRSATLLLLLLASSTCLTAQAKKAPVRPKARQFHARLVVKASVDESFEYKRDEGREHDSQKGTAHFDLSYSQNYFVTVENGFVSLSHAEGPASTSVNGHVSTNTENRSDPSPKQTFTEDFASARRSDNNADEGTSNGSAIVIEEFATSGQGLAIRVAMDGLLVGKCTSSVPPGNICIGDAFTTINESTGTNSSAHTDASPNTMKFRYTFDFYGKPTPDSPARTCGDCFNGADVQGGLNDNYSFNGTYTKNTDDKGWKRTFNVTIQAQLMPLN
jgi:hypothetical protein